MKAKPCGFYTVAWNLWTHSHSRHLATAWEAKEALQAHMNIFWLVSADAPDQGYRFPSSPGLGSAVSKLQSIVCRGKEQ